MKLAEVARSLGWERLGGGDAEAEVTMGYTSDLLSDVMGNAEAGSVFLTIQAHKNTVAVAALAGLSAILLCSGRQAPPDMLQAAEQEGIPVFRTSENQFLASYHLGRLLGLG